MSQAKTITIEELNRLQERLGRSRSGIRNQTMIYLTHWSGMRVGEVAALKIKDVINRDGSIKSEVHLAASQTKGNSSRTVMIPKKLQDVLLRYVATIWTNNLDRPLFISTRTGQGFTANSLGNLMKSFYVNAGIDNGSSHSGRRTFITTLAHKGVSARILQSLAGHKHLGTTQRYIDINDDMCKQAVELI